MAIQKPITYENGVTCAYHKIGHISINALGEKKSVSVMIHSFVDSVYRNDSELNDVYQDVIALRMTNEELQKKPIFELLYEKIKETERYSGASDC